MIFFLAICVFGEPDVFCGRTACFEAEISLEQDVYLPVSWEKLDGNVKKQLDVEDEKYRGSDNRQLLIHNVDKDDEAGYQAVLARNCDVNILSNKVYLRPKGGIYLFQNSLSDSFLLHSFDRLISYLDLCTIAFNI